MLRKSACSSPKLEAKGGETRCLVGCPAALSQPWQEDVELNSIAAMANLFLELFLIVGCRPFNSEKAKTLCHKFCVLYAALHDKAVAEGRPDWKLKPKFHMFQEHILIFITNMIQ